MVFILFFCFKHTCDHVNLRTDVEFTMLISFQAYIKHMLHLKAPHACSVCSQDELACGLLAAEHWCFHIIMICTDVHVGSKSG